jgi:ligand-binding sensor domain-containing protein
LNLLWRYDGQGWERFSKEEGYDGNNSIETIYEDRAGRIWLGTSAGLLRFRDGRFEDFGAATGLGPGRVGAVFEDREGRLWVGVKGIGLNVLDPAWLTFTTADGLSRGSVTALADWAGRLVVGTRAGLSWASGSGFDQVQAFANRRIQCVLPDGLDRCWVAHDAGVSLVDRDGRLISVRETPPTTRGTDVIRGLARDAFGTLWSVPLGGGLRRQDAAGTLTLTTRDRLADNVTSCLCLDAQGSLWIGTRYHGVSRYDRTNFCNYTRTDGLAGDYVTAISRGPGGTLWFGTTTGLSR